MIKEEFIDRLIKLRVSKGVSARDMSLSIGQSAGYINNIENGVNLPSMTVFFYICEYLEISPMEFFDIKNTSPEKTKELLEASKGLDFETMKHIIEILKKIKK